MAVTRESAQYFMEMDPKYSGAQFLVEPASPQPADTDTSFSANEAMVLASLDAEVARIRQCAVEREKTLPIHKR